MFEVLLEEDFFGSSCRYFGLDLLIRFLVVGYFVVGNDKLFGEVRTVRLGRRLNITDAFKRRRLAVPKPKRVNVGTNRS